MVGIECSRLIRKGNGTFQNVQENSVKEIRTFQKVIEHSSFCKLKFLESSRYFGNFWKFPKGLDNSRANLRIPDQSVKSPDEEFGFTNEFSRRFEKVLETSAIY